MLIGARPGLGLGCGIPGFEGGGIAAGDTADAPVLGAIAAGDGVSVAIHVAERAGGVQARNRVAARIDDVGVLVAASTADGIADARVQRNGVERTGLDLCQLLAAEVLVSA